MRHRVKQYTNPKMPHSTFDLDNRQLQKHSESVQTNDEPLHSELRARKVHLCACRS